jgi:hypothetical protein
MTTERQILANQLNAQASTGPKTAEGLAMSSQNARKPKLPRGANLAQVESDAFDQRLRDWAFRYGYLTPDRQWALVELVRESIRLDQFHEKTLAIRARLAERAEAVWNDDRSQVARKLAAKLSKQPDLISNELEASPQGCQWKLDRWKSLATINQTADAWNETHRTIAQDLLGIIPGLRGGPCAIDPPTMSNDRAHHQTHRQTIIQDEIDRLTTHQAGHLTKLDEWDRQRALFGIDHEENKELKLVNKEIHAIDRKMVSLRKWIENTDAPQSKQVPNLPNISIGMDSPPHPAFQNSDQFHSLMNSPTRILPSDLRLSTDLSEKLALEADLDDLDEPYGDDFIASLDPALIATDYRQPNRQARRAIAKKKRENR